MNLYDYELCIVTKDYTNEDKRPNTFFPKHDTRKRKLVNADFLPRGFKARQKQHC